MIDSLQTMEARWAARDAERAWKEHRQHCPGCDLASRKRQWRALCQAGTELYHERSGTAAELKRDREADRQPVSGQGTLC